MKIIPLSEGSFTVDKTKKFVPFDIGNDDIKSRPPGSLLVEVQPFVVIMESDIILLDTGLGFDVDGELQLIGNLKSAGIMPQQVTKVLLSHLHKDHAGGIGSCDNLGHHHLSFPNATYYVHQAELNDALAGENSPSYNCNSLGVLKQENNVALLTGSSGQIGESIFWEISGGHSKNHLVFWLKANGETIFFAGDEAPQHQQLNRKFIAKYDYDGRRAMELRKQWKETADAEGWTFLFYHDIKKPVLRVGPNR